MFLKKSFAREIEQDFQIELDPVRIKKQKYQDALTNLVSAANILDEAGLTKEANKVTTLLQKIAWNVPTNDPAMSGLTSQKMESNLAEKGWVFNAEDGEIVDVVDPSEKLNAEDELVVEDIAEDSANATAIE